MSYSFKVVFSTLPVYSLYFFKALRINCIKKDKVCVTREKGESDVTRMCEFNYALLKKFCWRLKADSRGLFYKVLELNMSWTEEDTMLVVVRSHYG